MSIYVYACDSSCQFCLTIQAFNMWLEKKNPSSKQKKEKFKELISGIFGVRPLIIHKSTCLLVQSPVQTVCS